MTRLGIDPIATVARDIDRLATIERRLRLVMQLQELPRMVLASLLPDEPEELALADAIDRLGPILVALEFELRAVCHEKGRALVARRKCYHRFPADVIGAPCEICGTTPAELAR